MYKKAKERISKKWAFISLTVLFGGLLLTGFGAAALIEMSNEPNGEKKIGNGYVIKIDMTVKNYDIAYPVFRVEKVDMALRNYVSHRVDDFWRELGDKKNDPRNYLTIRYTIMHYGAQTVTVTFHEQKQVVGHPTASMQTMMTFDLKQQKRLALADLFKDKKAADAFFARVLHDYFKNETPGQYSPAELQQYKGFQLEMVRDFMMSDDAIVLSFNPHQLASAQDIKTVSIKKELLKDILKAAYIKPDTSKIKGEMPKPTYSITTMPKHDVPVDPHGKMLALTFDDGPGSLTSRLLDVLKQHNARATFFVIGRQVPGHASVMKRMVADGHEIGNHSWDHPNLTLISPAVLQQQIDQTQQAIQQATGGYSPRIMRPPQGAINASVTGFMQARGLEVVLWNVDTNDWRDRNAALIYQRIMSSAADGRVILLHDIHPTSVDASVRAIADLAGQGYQLVTVSELYQHR